MRVLENVFSEYYNAIVDTDRDRAFLVVDKALEEGIPPEDIIFSVVIPSIDKMMSYLVSENGATLSQHYICSKVSSEITDRLIPLFSENAGRKGLVILGTAQGDFHGLGKKIVSGCLKANMYDVIDLGINVSAEKFVEQAILHQAQIIGVSAMMLHTAVGENGAIKVKALLQERHLSDQIKMIVGGAPYRFDSELHQRVNADGWSENALEAVKVVDRLIGEEINR